MRIRSSGWVKTGALAGGLAVALTGCGRTNIPQDTLNPAGPYARTIDRLFNLSFWMAAAVFVLVEGLLVLAVVKFRHRPGRAVPVQVHGNKRLEIGWTILPSVLLAFLAVVTIPVIFSLAAEPTGALQISVTGHQWWWDVRYPRLRVHTANEIHIPVGQPVYITLTSGDSGAAGPAVIHSFWIPRLAGKQDLEPGRVNHLKIQADRAGTYLGQCAEYCGASHANMRLKVIADPPSRFQTWAAAEAAPVAGQPPPAVLAIMQQVGCGGCHTIGGVQGFAGVIGPDLTHFASRTTFAGASEPNRPAQLAAWLRDPQAVKPGNDMTIGPGGRPGRSQLSEAEIRSLVAYLGSLK